MTKAEIRMNARLNVEELIVKDCAAKLTSLVETIQEDWTVEDRCPLARCLE